MSKSNSRESVSPSHSTSHENYYAILADLGKSEAETFKKVKDSKPQFMNMEFIQSSSENYTYKVTSRGPVCYSCIYQDDKYNYRHIILSDGVRNYAEHKMRKTNSFLSEYCIVNELQIDIGRGWKHFMIYDGKLRELILRKPLSAEDRLKRSILHQTEYNE